MTLCATNDIVITLSRTKLQVTTEKRTNLVIINEVSNSYFRKSFIFKKIIIAVMFIKIHLLQNNNNKEKIKLTNYLQYR